MTMSPGPATIAGHRLLLKCALDRILAGMVLVLAAGWLLAVAVALRVESPAPVLSRERRLGRDGQPFWLLTFRTSRLEVPAGEAATRGGRIRVLTPVGRLVRRCYLDELPKLINVVRGDMSLVGPPPQLPWAADGRPPLRVKPGLSGLHLAGPRSRGSVAAPLDVDEYARGYSIGTDLLILGRALRAGMSGPHAH